MSGTIFVIILCVVFGAAGIWAWSVENGGFGRKKPDAEKPNDEKDNGETKQ